MPSVEEEAVFFNSKISIAYNYNIFFCEICKIKQINKTTNFSGLKIQHEQTLLNSEFAIKKKRTLKNFLILHTRRKKKKQQEIQDFNYTKTKIKYGMNSQQWDRQNVAQISKRGADISHKV